MPVDPNVPAVVASARGASVTVIGLTGKIASGKSAVAGLLADRGAAVLDCDRVAHEVTAPGTPGLAAVVARFGEGVVRPDGALDRAALAARVFSNPAELADLEAIVHPLVSAEKDAWLAACRQPVAVVEAVKLVEAGYHLGCDHVWLVSAPAELRIRRLIEQRGLSSEDAARRVAAQDDAPARRVADEVIDNDGTLQQLAARVEAAWRRLFP